MNSPTESQGSAIMRRPRLLFLAWCLANLLMMAGVGRLLAWFDPLSFRPVGWIALLLVIAVRAEVLSRLPPLVRQSGWMLLRPVIVWEFAGWLGLAWAGLLPWPWGACLAIALVGAGSAIVLARRHRPLDGERFPVIDQGYFLWTRGHFDDWSARRHVLAHLIFAAVGALALSAMLRVSPVDAEGLLAYQRAFVWAMGAGLLVPLLQVNPQRGISFVHFGSVGLVVATLAHVIDPRASWPPIVLGATLAMPFPGLTTALLMHVPPRQRRAALLTAEGLAVLASLLGVALSQLPQDAARGLAFTAAVSVLGTTLRLYFRELVEIVMEIVFWPMYRFQVTGPGLIHLPWRGPVLVLANHAAYFDPLFLGKYLPLRLRALMISTMLDKPFLRWLAGDIYGAIRVPDKAGFRRTMPELDEAVSALRHGENLIIFPEAWLRRREDVPLHRFAQGVYRILLERPETPILPCWIETSWGSFLSYKNGPPGKNKPFDWFYKIVIAYGEPEIVPPEMLRDHRTARNYLMERVLHARTYLGLPAFPVPGLTPIEADVAEPSPQPISREPGKTS
jgi:1-acyl-sn-glycerol-3-phosphate acyltransferase